MKNKRKKGFTLIELLAIIVILAIIAVITVPIILNVIEDAKKGSIKDSAYGYKDAINKYYVSELFDSNDLKLDGTYTIENGKLGSYEIPFTGTTPTGGYLTYENNILTDGCITMDEYKVTVSDGEVTTVEKGSCGETSNPKAITIINQEEKGKLLSGDEVRIGETEHFYVVSSNENETVLLSKYNLLVGGVYGDYTQSYNKIRDILETEEGYGLQNEIAGRYDSNTKTYIGTLPFSSTKYWSGQVGDGLKYPGDFSSGANYPYVYDSNSNLYSYVESYKMELEKLGANIIDARLLTYAEAESLGCDGVKYSCSSASEKNKFIYSCSYWFGSLGSKSPGFDVWKTSSSGYFEDYDATYNFPVAAGVRPAIIVNTSDIEI